MAYPLTKYASDLPDLPDLLRAVAEWKKLRAAIVEKDYYLIRTLHSLRIAHDGQFILKGGTSLSKGWHLLDRLSEDLDILVRAEGGAAARDTRLRALRDTVGKTPGLELDSADKRARSEKGLSRTAVFCYHSVATDLPGLSRDILFEAGYRGSSAAAVRKEIRSYVAEYAAVNNRLDLAEDLQPFDIELQSVRRTFVEKAFAVHAAYCKNRCENRMRHYYDLFRLCGLDEIKSYVGSDDYQACVKDVKRISRDQFPDQAVPDADSFSESPAFKPDSSGLGELERNYRLESDLFFRQQPPLADVLARIGELLPNL